MNVVYFCDDVYDDVLQKNVSKLKAEMWSFQRIGPKKVKEKQRQQQQFYKHKATAAAAAIADEWNVKDRPYQALS